MGSILALPVMFILKMLHLEPSDFFYWCKYAISYLYVALYKWTIKGRLHFFDCYSKDPETVGYMSPEIERELESPHSDYHLLEAKDQILCYGVNSKSECLIVSISRFCNEKAEACIYLKLASGKIYQLKETTNFQQPGSDKKIFSCGDLQMHYISPMRRWRIFFSGFLKETTDKSAKDERMVYVKFAFIWSASSDVFDFTSDMSTELLADGLAHAKWKSFLPPLSNYQEDFNMYAQAGIITGTISIEDTLENYEVYLFGQRMRCLDRKKEEEFHHALGYVHKNGTFVHFGMASVTNVVKNFHFGFIVKPNSNIKALTKAEISDMKSLVASDSRNLKASLRVHKEDPSSFSGCIIDSLPKSHHTDESGGVTYMNILSFYLNGKKGTGVLIKGAFKEGPQKTYCKVKKTPALPSAFPLVVPFTDNICQASEITGGKGSSLGKLTHLSKDLSTFIVPSGMVVTTASYEMFLSQEILREIEKLENVLYGNVVGNVKEASKRVSEKIVGATIPNKIQKEIAESLKRIFGGGLHSKKFAVRSSATGEDTEQMSAAGQMETFLGVSGINEILSAVKKCWASQFGYIAIQYKRRYGQILNSPMAVVIQEMVSCDVAGVLFTCNPLTGSPTVMTITANYGLGESVVSGSEEPDTIELARDYNDKLHFKSTSIGAKSHRIVVKDNGTSLEKVSEEEKKECSISQENALRLGELAVKIERYYRSKRDIEWGFWNNNLYVFQSRPVTSEIQETDFEIEHELDGPLRIENDYFSVSNTGEVLPGAMSTLGFDTFFRFFSVNMKREKVSNWQPEPTKYFANMWLTMYNHVMFNVADLFRSRSEEEQDSVSKATMIAFAGRIINESEIFEISSERHAEKGKQDFIEDMFRNAKVLCFSSRRLKKGQKDYRNFRIHEECTTSEEVFESLIRNICDMDEIYTIHMCCSQASTLWNMFILSTLVQAKKGIDEDVYRDLGNLLTTSSYVESADVPSAIQNLAHHISLAIKPEAFKKMQLEEALEWLKTSSTSASNLFREFLEKHGHRCVMEFDIYSTTWGTDPKLLVKLLQNLVGTVNKDPSGKKSISANKIISELTTPLGFLSKLKLRILLPLSRQGVQSRENSKSLLVKRVDNWRKGFRYLAKRLVSEGRIPEEDILFFMTVEDIKELLRTRSPKILAKAHHRQKLHPQMNKYIFPEMMRGLPKPINYADSPVNDTGDNFEMKGIPVSQGIAKGFIRVALCLDDAADLKPGEILLAYGTDIGWSPYFPIVAGVVTELGGLISHGAVVSREYGLPCIAGLHGATKNFKTGEYVLLDGNKGILRKIPPPTE